jgi:hypothetical protein
MVQLPLTLTPCDGALQVTFADGAPQHAVYVSTSPGAEPATPTVSFNGPQGVIPGLTNGQTYYVIGRAFTNGVASNPTPEASAIPVALAAPVSIVATAGLRQIGVTFDAIPGCTYDLFIATASGQEGANPVFTGSVVTAYNFTGLLDGTEYFIQVSAVNPCGQMVRSGEIAVTTKVFMPTIAPAGGEFNTPQAVTIASDVPGSAIYYTLDGSQPTTASTLYSGPFNLSNNAVVNAIAVNGSATSATRTSGEFDFLIAQLTGLSWRIPCVAPASGGGCTCVDPPVDTATVTGNAGHRYSVQIRIRGVVELNNYSGGTNNGGYLQIGGSPATPNNNVYELQVSSPAQTYYINLDTTPITTAVPILAIDYLANIEVDVGATVSLIALTRDGLQTTNSGNLTVTDDNPSQPVVVSQPYNGQFAQIDAVSFTPI